MPIKHSPLTSIQKGMWFHNQSEPHSGVDVQQIIITFNEPLNRALFAQAWQAIGNEHEVLRSFFITSDIGEPAQCFADGVEIPVVYEDWSASTEVDQAQKFTNFLVEDRRNGFNIDVPSLMRVSVFKLKPDGYRCVWTFHHIQVDACSYTNLLKELFQRYDALVAGIKWEASSQRPFSDYVDWISTQSFSESQAYWQELLHGFTAATPLTINESDDYPQIAAATASVEIQVPAAATNQLSILAHQFDVTVNTLLQGAWALMLHHYSNEKDIVFAATRAGRHGIDGMEDMVGVFINTLPMRSTVQDGMSLQAFMQSLRVQWVAMRPHEHTPLAAVQKWSEIKPGESLFHSLVVFENQDLNTTIHQQNEKWQQRTVSYQGQTNFPLTLMAYNGSELILRLEYDPALFSEVRGKRLLGHLQTLLVALPDYADKPALLVPYLTSVEKQQLLEVWNPAYDASLVTEPVHSMFAKQAARSSEKTAVFFQEETLTYRQLNERSNQLAHYLQEQGVGTGTLVGIFLERSLHTIVSMMAVLKAGAAYVPLDPQYPQDRLAHMIADSQMPLILTESKVVDLLPAHSAQTVIVENIALILTNYPTIEPATTVTLEDLAYVIYTSGSTGKPKGVQVPHHGLINFLLSMKDEPGLTAADVLVAVTTISFDIAELEMYLPLIMGAKLVIAADNVTVDGRALADLLARHEATLLQATPATWRMLLDSGWNGRSGLKMLCGGEPLPRRLADKLLVGGGELWNMYGPTETTIWSSVSQVFPDDAAINIGKPILNTSMYILDENLQLVPAGTIGELCIGGLGVTHGYLNRPELTGEKFLANPFRPDDIIYKTGDLARFNPDGTIDCLGRVDHQVKIRGFRIELGEIEAIVSQHPDVQEAVVVAHTTPAGSKQLIGYVEPKANASPTTSDLRKFAQTKLPDYMVPATFIKLDTFPLTDNGKINRRALPEPDGERPDLENAFVPAKTSTEKRLATLWEEVLLVNKIGVHDSFFDLGGDSLLVVRILNQIREQFDVNLAVHELFSYRTIRTLAERIDETGDNTTGKTAVNIDARAEKRRKGRAHGSEDIAIIGMAGRFPKARNLDEFWNNLINSVESLRHLTDEELASVELDYETLKEDPDYIPATGLLEDADLFDANFFNIKPYEARAIDPQHRLWLETAWECMENAGYAPEKYPGAVGVYTGSTMNNYLFYNLFSDRNTIEGFVRMQSAESLMYMLNNSRDYLPTRTAYQFNLTGPAINVQTACSTSLVTISLACQSLQNYESDMALAGGVCIFSPQERGYFYQEGGMRSSDGHCRPFDAKGSGTVFANGLGVVLLKRLEDALEDGDNILAVIKGTALNNDGTLKASYTAPSIDGQADVIAMAQAIAGFEPETISYIEAHGTATPLGDPIEMAALTKVFRQKTDKTQFCAVGSVKSNIGHLDAASGVAGLIKTVLALQNEQIPPTLHYEKPNPEIDFENSPFFVVDKLIPWPKGDRKRRAGVSSFGFGGTNAHVALEESPRIESSSSSRSRQLIMLSARTETALQKQAENLANHLKTNPVNFADVAYTLNIGRTEHAHRRILVAQNEAAAIEALSNIKSGAKSHLKTSEPSLVFMFPGQGSQFVGMGQELYEQEPVFRDSINRSADILLPLLGVDLRQILYPEGDEVENVSEQLKQTGLAQPAIFMVSYALAELWQSWGLVPEAMVGHSVGEFAAATVAGIFSLEDALAIIASRAKLMQSLPGGSMRAIRMTADEVIPYLNGSVSLAAQNAPGICIVSGSNDAIAAFDERMAAQELDTIELHTSHAFHSEMMEPILEPFREVVAKATFYAPQTPIVSTVTGDWMTDEQAMSPDYWVQQLRQAVLFSPAVTVLQEEPGRILLEVGPGQALSNAARQHVNGDAAQVVIDSLGHPKKANPALETMLEALGRLWMAGADIDWDAFYANERRLRVPLPTYPFERQRYWVDPPLLEMNGVRETAVSPISPANISTPVPTDAVVEIPPQQTISLSRKERLILKLSTLLEQISGLDIDPDDKELTFLQLGFDSLFLTQASSNLKREFGIKISFRQMLDEYSTLETLAAYIDTQLADNAFPDESVAKTMPAVAQSPVSSLPNLPVTKQAPIIEQRKSTAPSEGNAVEQLIAQQLQIIAQQSAILQTPVSAPPQNESSVLASEGSKLEQLMAQQLQIMSQQLALFQPDTAPIEASSTSPDFASPTSGLSPIIEVEDIDEDDVSPIVPIIRTSPLALSLEQERFWFLDQLEPNKSTYNIFEAYRIRGNINIPVFEKCINEVLQRHEILRTIFSADSGDLQQIIQPYQPYTLPVVDLSHLDEAVRDAEAKKLLKEASYQPFDLSHDLMLRTKIIQLDSEDQIFFICMHHIASDGWSFNIFQDELFSLYETYLQNGTFVLPALPFQYADYAEWQRKFLQSDDIKIQMSYWQQQLGGELPNVEIPTDYARPPVRTFSGNYQHMLLSPDLSADLKGLARQQGVTLFMLMLAAFKLLVSRYTGQEDILIGTPIATRDKPNLNLLIGCFLNTIVLRTDVTGEIQFADLVKRVQQVSLDAYKNQDMPFDELLKTLQPTRDLSRTPLFQIFFNMLMLKDQDDNLPGITDKQPLLLDEDSKFDLTLYVTDKNPQIALKLVYNADLYTPDHMAELVEQYVVLLKQVTENPHQQTSEISLITDKAQVVLPNPATPLANKWHGVIHEQISKQAQRYPSKVAVVDNVDSWTYQTLEQHSNQLAHYLIDSGLKSQDVIAVYAHRSASLVWALLSIQKMGGAFVILDPAYPSERLVEYLNQSKPKAIISLNAAVDMPQALDSWLTENGIDCRIKLPRLSDIAQFDVLSQYPTAAPSVIVEPNDLAYIVFTSGSTGQPKGIMGQHNPLSHFLYWHTNNFDFQVSDKFSLLSGLAHDPLLRDIFTPLYIGATLCIPTQEDMLLPGRLANWLNNASINNVHLTPTMGQVVTMNAENVMLSSLRYAFFGGEMLTERVIAQLQNMAPHLTCVNLYGATETPQAMSYHPVDLAKEKDNNGNGIPLGRGVSDVQLLVLDENGRSAGIGELGEIHVRTPYLAKGYLNNDQLTKERFLHNPLSSIENDRLYKTGDLGRYQLDGTVRFIGRKDQQVKIRGFRVELGEIETILTNHPTIMDAVVILREDNVDDKRLVAYLVTKDEMSVTEVRQYLQPKLPDYMQPAAYVFLDEIPLTPNGKIARQSLPKPDYGREQETTQYTAARNELEAQMVDIWQQVLKVKPIGIHDNFFHLGGHSLIALRLFAKIEELTGEKLPLATLFEAPTIAELLDRIGSTDQRKDWSVLVPIQKKGEEKPFFYVTPYSISVLQFNDIGRHFTERPFYGIQPLGLSEGEEIHTTIEEMAAYNIQAIQSVQPHGPYNLGGHCAGAWVAYEMALQLEQKGEAVDYLAIVDSPAPNYVEPGRGSLEHAMNRMTYYVKDRRLIHALGWKIKLQAERRLLYRHGTTQTQRTQKVRTIHDQAFDDYQIRSGYNGPMTIIRSSDNINIFATDGWYKNWLAFTSQEVEIIDIHSTHAMLIFDPQAGILANHLSSGVSQSQLEAQY